ncbi:ABC transporter ATP-binding protein [Desulfonatronovibrio hydrogenovorans]|uniref:ABC transporter ATP-binding protein n=1 Tax=Desulfonatronovibrio hydrogenovorans TaxID=53245 RepID=UPI00048E286E|nr:ATP-binding cassette domain-containing protein [Desulfonatronovibrio hydrogenovorans]
MIVLDKICKTFPGSRTPAVDQISFQVNQGNICVFVGPSGCGKTTILRMINRLEEPDSGQISVNNRNIKNLNPDILRRTMGYVIQQIGLLPHKTIEQNVSLVPELLGWSKSKTAARVLELLSLVGLDPDQVRHKYPHQLSGGQSQRVGVARAMAADPPIMLMDEPFGAVDPIVRVHLQDEFIRLQQKLKKTICFVTHDINEAIKMGDYLIVLNQGRLIQMGTPIEVLTEPADAFVLDLLGNDRGVKILDLTRSETLMEPLDQTPENLDPCLVQALEPVKIALELMMKNNTDQVGVCRNGQLVGILSWNRIKQYINRVSGEGT